MTKYLIKASYTAEGTRGLLKKGGTNRKKAIDEMVKAVGGKLDFFYYACGAYDVYAVCSLPDVATASAIMLSINASGLVNVCSELLIDPEEIDKAKNMVVKYRTPGN
jgi:uncharacterized protein with GYD domain